MKLIKRDRLNLLENLRVDPQLASYVYLISVLSAHPSIVVLEHVVMPVESVIETALYEDKRLVAHVASESPVVIVPNDEKTSLIYDDFFKIHIMCMRKRISNVIIMYMNIEHWKYRPIYT